MSSKIIEAVDDAEIQGFAKFKTDKGIDMVVCTQAELDAVIKQREDEAIRMYCESMVYA